jgi:hypothetical protein
MRRVQAEGGFAAVLAKGDANAGSVLVILTEKGGNPRVMERILQPDGSDVWEDILPQAAGNEQEFDSFLARRRKYDPDLWLIELDVPSAKRFAAEMNGGD